MLHHTSGRVRRPGARQRQRRQRPCRRHCQWLKRDRPRPRPCRRERQSIPTSSTHLARHRLGIQVSMAAPRWRRLLSLHRRWPQALRRRSGPKAGTRTWRDIGRYVLGSDPSPRFRHPRLHWRHPRSSRLTVTFGLASRHDRRRRCRLCRYRLRCLPRHLRTICQAHALRSPRHRRSVTDQQVQSCRLLSPHRLSRQARRSPRNPRRHPRRSLEVLRLRRHRRRCERRKLRLWHRSDRMRTLCRSEARAMRPSSRWASNPRR